jgi:D-alanyl-D-alanine carboxypeptidase
MLEKCTFKTVILSLVGLLLLSHPLEAKYAAIVMDAGTGKVIHAEAPDKPIKPASLTKMMTLYLTFQALEKGTLTLNQRLPISRHAANQSPCKLGLRPGNTIRVQDAILALITKSANDASVVLAEALAGTEVKFASIMTSQAHTLGMSRTIFKNASGLPNAKQVSTARDMARLSQALIRHFPSYYGHFATKVFTYQGVAHRNHNHLVGEVIGYGNAPIVIDGVKTGFTNASGFNLAASAKHGNQRLIGVVVGGENRHWRDRRMKQLLSSAFGVKGAKPPKLLKAQHVEIGSLITAANQEQSSKSHTKASKRLAPSKMKASAAGIKQVSVMKASASKAKWRIQVGAFSRAKDAQAALKKAGSKITALTRKQRSPHVASAGKRKKLFKAQFVNMTQVQAKQSCSQIKQAGLECLIIRG